jgi:methionine--tRNA ligase beta chain
MISFEDFKKIEIKIGKVISAQKVEGADKLVKFMFDIGEAQPVQILAGIAEFFPDLSVLVGEEMPVVVNLEPKMLKGHESHGMILAVDAGGKPVLLHPKEEVPPGSVVR